VNRFHAPSKEQVRTRLKQLLVEIAKIPAEQIRDGATVDEQLRMESVAFIEIQVAIEDEYEIELDPLHIIELNEFAMIVDYIHSCAAHPNDA
jgi:acyl carrier protein